ncbi:MAG TPA: YlmC/YmxH family sporulation protein [Clostridiales bacterium]|nr:YlmC/YmxH family sporulation protein [Clostridiales bacterium]
MIRIWDFKQKEVVNVFNGKKLGYPKDIEIDPDTGRVSTVIIPFGRSITNIWVQEKELIIPWNYIIKIGIDVILVDIDDKTVHECE